MKIGDIVYHRDTGLQLIVTRLQKHTVFWIVCECASKDKSVQPFLGECSFLETDLCNKMPTNILERIT